jgi:hypothetical protein
VSKFLRRGIDVSFATKREIRTATDSRGESEAKWAGVKRVGSRKRLGDWTIDVRKAGRLNWNIT